MGRIITCRLSAVNHSLGGYNEQVHSLLVTINVLFVVIRAVLLKIVGCDAVRAFSQMFSTSAP